MNHFFAYLSRMRFINRYWGDGTNVEPAPAQPNLELDLTDPASLSYLNGAKRCSYKTTALGLHLTLGSEARDPYFYVDYTGLLDTYQAEDYYILEIEYMIPETNSLEGYSSEIYLCTGNRWGAEADISVVQALAPPDGQYHTLRLDLSQSKYWHGTIHKIRIDNSR